MAETSYGADLVLAAHGIQLGDTQALEDMYRLVTPGLRAFLALRVPRDLIDDYSHDIFLALVRFIQTGNVRNPQCLPGIIRTIALRFVSEHKRIVSKSPTSVESVSFERFVPDRRTDLESNYQRQQQMELAMSTLAMLRDREREILRRFYLEEQPQDQICRDMGLTETQFRLLKSRAKARFAEIGRKRMRRLLPRVA